MAHELTPDSSLGFGSLQPLPLSVDFCSRVLPPNCAAARVLLDVIKASIPDAQLEEIRQFGNKALWIEYQTRKGRVARRNGGEANVRLAFHGTSDPRKILGDGLSANSNGFDFRHSAAGAYGRGAYFAAHAAYPVSIHPKCRNRDGTFTFIVAEVALGARCDLGDRTDTSLNVPPERRQGLLYDSVRGTENGIGAAAGDVAFGEQFVVYERDQAYPHFLVTIRIAEIAGGQPPDWWHAASLREGEGQRVCEFHIAQVRGRARPECAFVGFSVLDISCAELYRVSVDSNAFPTCSLRTWHASQVYGAQVAWLVSTFPPSVLQTGRCDFQRYGEREDEWTTQGKKWTSPRITFQPAFESEPQAIVATTLIDATSPLRYNSGLRADRAGLTVTCSTWADTRLRGMGFHWLASTLPKTRLQMGRISGNHDNFRENLPQLLEYQEPCERFGNLPRVQFDPPFRSPPKVIVFVHGLDAVPSKIVRFHLTPNDVTASGFTPRVRTWLDSQLHWLEASFIAWI